MMIGIYNMVKIYELVGKKYSDLVNFDNTKMYVESWFDEVCDACPNIDRSKMKKYMNRYDKTRNPILLKLSESGKKAYHLGDVDDLSQMSSFSNDTVTTIKSNKEDELSAMFSNTLEDSTYLENASYISK